MNSAYKQIEEIVKENFKCSDEKKNKSFSEIKEILKKMESNILEIKDLDGKEIVIPSYQRGYRWGEDEIVKLVEDIMENNKKSYFLQPIIYRKGQYEKNIIVDGQQRLTSIYIILKVIEKKGNISIEDLPQYTIEYETRDESTEYLKNLTSEKTDLTIDLFHMNLVKEKVEELINKMQNVELLKKNLLKTKFIYHEIDPKDENKIFKRINTGKIALTNGELTKGLVLNKSTKKEEWAVLWDEMEKTLHNEDFWCMYNNELEKYQETRIDYVLEVVAESILKEKDIKNKKGSNYWIFEVLESFSKENGIESLWNKIRTCYRTLKRWYDNTEIYHLAGYILSNGYKEYNVLKLIEIYNEEKDNKAFIEELYRVIKKCNEKIFIKVDNIPEKIRNMYPNIINRKEIRIEDIVSLKIVCENLNYNNNYEGIKKILLLFNILTFLSNQKNENIEFNKFSFGNYKNENWDIEHIHARNDNTDGSLKLLEEAINDKDKEALKKIKEEIENQDIEIENKDTIIFNKFYESILSSEDEEEMSDENTINSLRNLTLLDSTTNRGIQDNVFIIKRHLVLKRDKERLFIPICTRNVFLKYYSKNIRQIACWSESDGEEYLKEIIRVIETSPIYNKEKLESNEQ